MSGLEWLPGFLADHPRLLVVTGAGCSTGSGIPGYRDETGAWKARPPTHYQDFVQSDAARRRYWSRSAIGWPRVAEAVPNRAHRALAHLEAVGHVETLVTQNVDGLHQRAGSRRVVDLHGRLDEVECLGCGFRLSRHDVQQMLLGWNRTPVQRSGGETGDARPDGDAEGEVEVADFAVPDCPACGGVLKPAVVFFGENVPAPRVETAMQGLAQADALLVVGSSLMVFSSYRFCLAAQAMGKPIAAINLGRTRADALLTLKVAEECGEALTSLCGMLGHAVQE